MKEGENERCVTTILKTAEAADSLSQTQEIELIWYYLIQSEKCYLMGWMALRYSKVKLI